MPRIRRLDNEISARQLRRRIFNDTQLLTKKLCPDVCTIKSSVTTLSLNCDQYIVPDSLQDLNNNLVKSFSSEERPNCSTNSNELLKPNSIFPVPTTSNQNDILSEKNENSFRDKITTWAVTEHITHKSLNKLLQILKTHSCHSDLPSDS